MLLIWDSYWAPAGPILPIPTPPLVMSSCRLLENCPFWRFLIAVNTPVSTFFSADVRT